MTEAEGMSRSASSLSEVSLPSSVLSVTASQSVYQPPQALSTEEVRKGRQGHQDSATRRALDTSLDDFLREMGLQGSVEGVTPPASARAAGRRVSSPFSPPAAAATAAPEKSGYPWKKVPAVPVKRTLPVQEKEGRPPATNLRAAAGERAPPSAAASSPMCPCCGGRWDESTQSRCGARSESAKTQQQQRATEWAALSQLSSFFVSLTHPPR